MYEIIQHRRLYCMAMELLPGKDLCEFVKGHAAGRLDERTTRRFVKQLASAIDYLHSRGIVHRDLKMQNIVVVPEQMLAKIIDFGLSNYWSLEEPLTTHCGSPEYAAPELFDLGRKYGPEVDLWSLGVVVFCIAAGRLPFQLDERSRLLSRDLQNRLLVSRIREGILPKHRKLVSHYSKDFARLVMGLLTTDPRERFRARDVLSHPWTKINHREEIRQLQESCVPSFPTTRTDRILWRLSRLVNATPREVKRRLLQEPFGGLGGMHRILWHGELKARWCLIEAFSPPRAPSGPPSVCGTRGCSAEAARTSPPLPRRNRHGKTPISLEMCPASGSSALPGGWSADFLSSISVTDQVGSLVLPLCGKYAVYNCNCYCNKSICRASREPPQLATADHGSGSSSSAAATRTATGNRKSK